MKLCIRKYCSQSHTEIFSYSTLKIFRKDKSSEIKEKKLEIQEKKLKIPEKPDFGTSRRNEMNIQMLSSSLYEQIFGSSIKQKNHDINFINKCQEELKKHGIDFENNSTVPDVDIKLPPLKGSNIEEHFLEISKEQSGPYNILIVSILDDLPEPPKIWKKIPGWTCYDPITGPRSVPYPEEDSLIFDIEVCMSVGAGPTLACAAGNKYWYSWTSSNLSSSQSGKIEGHKYFINEMIPMESTDKQNGVVLEPSMKKPKIIVGHNVSYDRARIKEQYWMERTGTRFLDTMSLHVCVSGVTSYQRAILKSKKDLLDEDLDWSSQSSLNSLSEVYKLYCGGELSKDPRNVFVKGTLQDIDDDFQNLMEYCSNDVKATHKVLKNIYPLFQERFPHPATLAGMLEIGTAYLPVNSNWNRYIDESNLTYEDLDLEAKYLLGRRADQLCHLMHNEKYKENLWMWDEDWSTQEFKLNKPKVVRKKKITNQLVQEEIIEEDEEEIEILKRKFSYLNETSSLLPVRRNLLPGYPAWYRKLCDKPKIDDWCPGPQNIGTGMQIAPKLLSLCWEGYPLHYLKEQGWGFLMPFKKQLTDEDEVGKIPLENLVKKCPVFEVNREATLNESEEALDNLWRDVEVNLSKKDYYSKKKVNKTEGFYKGSGIWCNLEMESCCWFLKLPHKDGAGKNVGNPLAKDFLNKFSENVLSGDGTTAERIIDIARMLSYWRNNQNRISNQLVVWLQKKNLAKQLKQSEMEFGAIIPQVVVCGTLTRRAMEPTWMTASNAQRERVGSELRGMVQAPPGYRIVGADVDSQELWIASVLGDAHSTGIHGATPLGWMTLSGAKSSGTDMHSITAKAVGISRDHAKVINYARIYGAGQNFAERLLKQFNPTFSDGEAKSKAMKMFALTKGKKLYYPLPEFNEEIDYKGYTGYGALKIASSHRKAVSEMFEKPKWEGGTESAMFNRLEEIAGKENPVTPFLEGRLSRALETSFGTDDRFLPTKINWVVQSGAVDFLHIMLVSMRWLMGNRTRFSLSFHDEVRYLVKEEDSYKAALAMHLTNLLTRSFCAHRIGLTDLPQSIAFFTSVEVDTVLRKEAQMDCKTPSNPHGLSGGYKIGNGETLDIYSAVEKAGGGDLTQWEWHSKEFRNDKKEQIK